MTAPIDDKVVSASFESGKFESGVAKTISAINELKAAMKFGDAGKGFDQLNAAAGNVDLSHIANGVDNISSKFHVLGAVGFTVIQDLTNGAIGFGKKLASGIINPLVEGGKQRALNIEQAKFQFAGLGQNIKKSMASALEAVKGTSFGLDEAAKTAAQFGAAGITAGSKMTGALKGVAGIAALTNSSFGDISQIFTTIAGAGKINSEQLYQFATRGLNVAAALGKQMGKSEGQIRQMVTEGKITFPVFAKAMDDAFGKHAKEANKTFSGSLANMHAALARIGADAWTPFLKASRNVFNTLSPFFDNIHTAIQPLLDAFGTASLGGAKKISEIINGIDLKPLTQAVPHILGGFKNIFKAVGQVAKPLKEAFRDIFPKQAGDNLVKFSVIFERFTKALIPSQQTADALRKTFRGLFAIFDIGIQIVKGIFSVFGDLFHAIAPGAGGFLHLTGSVSDFLVALDLTLKKGGSLQHFFDSIGAFISKPVQALSKFAQGLGDAAGKMDPFQRLGDSMKTGMQDIAQGLSTINWKSIFTTLSVGFTAGLAYFVKSAFSGGALSGKLVQGIFGSILRAPTMQFHRAMSNVTLSMKSMQTQIQSKTIRNIAVSIALLAGSLVAMSLVDPKRLQNSLSVMAVAFGELLGAMKILDNISKSAGFIKLPFVASSLILLAVAIDTLVIAVILLSRLSWKELEKGLGGVATLLLSISAATGPISANSAGMVRAGIGITAIAVAMNILALAVKQMGALDLSTLGKGLGGVAAALIAIGAAANLFPPSGMVAIGIGLIGVGVGMKMLVGVIATLGNLNVSTLAKGIISISIALDAIGISMRAMPGNLPITAAGLILVGIALKSITGVISTLGGMSMKTLAKGIISLALALGILAIAAIAMNEGIAGAAGIAIMAGAVAILAPALKSLGDQSWGQIVKGLISLTAAFVVLAAAGILLAPVAPAILALGGALIAVGAGIALVGAGIALIGIGLSAIAVAGPAAIKLLVDALVQLVEVGPKVAAGLVKSFITAVQGIADAGPKLVESIAKIIGILADAIVKDAPKVGLAFTALIQTGLKVVNANIGPWVATGIHILEALLSGISKNISKIVTTAAQIVVRFLNTVASKAGDIVKAGLNIVVKIAAGIANGISKVTTATVKIVTKFLSTIASSAGKFIAAGANIIIKIVQGIGNAAGRVATAALNTAARFVERLASAIPKFANRVATAVINMINAMADVVRGRSAEFYGALGNLGSAIVEGLAQGIRAGVGNIKDALLSLIPGPLKKFASKLGIRSPSQVFHKIGENIVKGLASGITDNGVLATASAKKVAKDLDHVFSTALEGLFGDNFVKGISGGVLPQPSAITQQIKDTFSGVSNKLRADIKTQHDIINKARANNKKARDELNAEEKKPRKKRNQKTITRLTDEINANNDAIKKATYNLGRLGKGHDQVAVEVKNHRTELIKLAKQLDAENQKLDAANKALDDSKQAYIDAQKARDDYISSETDTLSTNALPDLPESNNAQDYIDSLSKSADATIIFNTSMQKLLDMGLSDDVYQQLLGIGPAADAFINSLIQLGPDGVKAINDSDAKIRSATGDLADRTGHHLFDAGVKIAEDAVKTGEQLVQGLIDGINGQPGIKALQNSIDTLVNEITKRIKKKLIIKSPSQVFAEIGTYTVLGLAQGIVDPSGLRAIDKSLSYISDYMTANVDPTITPILDLTHVKAGVAQMNGMLGASVSLANASSISASTSDSTDVASVGGTVVKFEQNNYSPETLSAIEIFRQTRNQLSQAKNIFTK